MPTFAFSLHSFSAKAKHSVIKHHKKFSLASATSAFQVESDCTNLTPMSRAVEGTWKQREGYQPCESHWIIFPSIKVLDIHTKG